MNKLTVENITTLTPFQEFISGTTNAWNLFSEIVKIRITVLVSLTTALGYFAGAGNLSFDFIFPVIGIFLLACSSAALNQYQERNTDALMERTKSRPIPSGRISS